jgi:hypothetical protein
MPEHNAATQFYTLISKALSDLWQGFFSIAPLLLSTTLAFINQFHPRFFLLPAIKPQFPHFPP